MSKDISKFYATKPFNVLSHELHEFFSQSTFNDNEENVRLSYILTNMSICCIHELNTCPVGIHARTGNYEKSPNVCWCFMWKQRHSFWNDRAYLPAFLISLVIRKGSRWFLSYHPILVNIHENIILDCIFEKRNNQYLRINLIWTFHNSYPFKYFNHSYHQL